MAFVSIIIPCRNEAETIPLLYDGLKWLERELPLMRFEYIWIDDGSQDDTYQILSGLQEADSRVKTIRFSRNFGKEAAIFSGLHQAKGDCCVVMDADLQHPVETIPEMIALWQEGYEVVEGRKESRGEEPGIRKAFANIFYRLLGRTIGMDMKNASDFKLLDRKAVQALCDLPERNTFFRALSFWVGYRSASVTYEVSERAAGTTKWSNRSLLKYGLKNLTAFSNKPLYLIFAFGALLILAGILLSIDAVVSHFRGRSAGGYPTLIIFLVFVAGGMMLSLGIIGAYIAMIYDEVKGRPRYIISEKKEKKEEKEECRNTERD